MDAHSKALLFLEGLLLLIVCCTVAGGERCLFHHVTVQAQQNASTGLTAEDVRKHIEEKVVWVDPQEQQWSCVDGRSTTPGLTTPAGDSGEFILGLAVYEERLLEVMPRKGRLHEVDVANLFEEFVRTIPYGRRFYLHTDEHAVERLRATLEDEEYDPARKPPEEDQPRLLELLTDPAYQGCGHLRLLLQHPDQYHVRPELTRWYLKAYFDFMWNKEHGGKLFHHTSTSVVELEGEHREQAVVVIDTDKSHMARGDVCMRLAPMIPGRDDLNSFFTDHGAFVSLGIRGEVARFFAEKLHEQFLLSGADVSHPTYKLGGNDYARLLARMNELGNVQLGLTVGYLAKGEPQFGVMIVLDRERRMAMIIGSLASLGAWVVALVGMILYGRRASREEDEALHYLV